MIGQNHPPPASHATVPEALALVAVAIGLADGIRTLVPDCTVGVVAGSPVGVAAACTTGADRCRGNVAPIARESRERQ